jgi:hypothetical protein
MLCAYAVDDNIVVNTNTYHALRAALRAMLFPSSYKHPSTRHPQRRCRCERLAQGKADKANARPATTGNIPTT